MKITVGDQVRVHFHPPGPWKSFSEGLVRRVDVTTPEGRFFVLEVRNEVLLDQPHWIRSDFHDYVQYESRNDFPGRIEVLSTAGHDVEREPASTPLSVLEAPEGSMREASEQHLGELDVSSEAEVETASEEGAGHESTQGDVEPQPVRTQGGLLSALFGRGR